MPDTTLTVDQFTHNILAALDKHRYNPNQAALHVRHLLRCNNYLVPQQHSVHRVVVEVLELLARADTYIADPKVACWLWEDHVPNDSIVTWSEIRADRLRGEAQQTMRTYLETLEPTETL